MAELSHFAARLLRPDASVLAETWIATEARALACSIHGSYVPRIGGII
jgi:hypothetical protein